jgi:hypothetical protein
MNDKFKIEHVTLNDQAVNCRTWRVVDDVGNTHAEYHKLEAAEVDCRQRNAIERMIEEYNRNKREKAK